MARLRSWARRAALVLLGPLLFLSLAEGVLRLARVGSPAPFFLPALLKDQPVWTDNAFYTRRYFEPGLERAPWPFTLPRAKAPDVIRIVVLGESAAMGDPTPEFGLTRQLEVLLGEAYPGRRFEVLNAAVTAINSHAVRAIAREAARHQPDYFVIYMGNNEVIGPYGPGTIHQAFSGSLPYIRVSLALRGTRLGQELLRTSRRLRGLKPREWKGMEMFLDRKIREDDPRMAHVYAFFERNLQDILAAARDSGAVPVLGTVAVNLRDCAPFASVHGDLDEPALQAWQADYDAAQAEERAERWTPALQAYERAAARDPAFAEGHFRQARMLERLERADEALPAYERARQADALRFRADARLNEIIRDTARRRTDVRLVDFDQQVRQASPHGLPGASLFVDHVHLNFAGNYQLARAMFDQMRDLLGEPGAAIPDETACRALLAFTPWHEHQEADHMYQRMLRAPFRQQVYHEESMRRLREQFSRLRRALTPQALAASVQAHRQAAAHRPADWALRRQLALILLEQEGGAKDALPELQAVADALPHLHAARYSLARALAEAGRLDEAWQILRSIRTTGREKADSLHQIGFELAQGHKWSAARSLFEETLRLAPNHAEAHSNLGLTLMSLGKIDEGIEHLQQSLRIQPDNVKARTNLGAALARRGQRTEAAQELERAARLGPLDADAQFNWGVFLVEERRPDEARLAFEAALAADPESADAHANLGLLMSRTYETAAAREHFEAALLLDPTLTMPQRQLASMDLQAGAITSALARFDASLETRTEAADRTWFARRLIDAGHIRAARDQFEAALALTNDVANAANDLAWLLATSGDDALRDGPRAVLYAQRAVAESQARSAGTLDTLAAAYAEAGDFAKAVATARQALEIATEGGPGGLADDIRSRLILYERREPFRDPIFAAPRP